jgi:hypothetical protein
VEATIAASSARAAGLGATHFVDDRLDVLEHLAGLVPAIVLVWAPNRHAKRSRVGAAGARLVTDAQPNSQSALEPPSLKKRAGA